jgi:hypothetical protein
MSSSEQRIGQVVLGLFLVLILASLLFDNALVDLLVEIGFALVAFYFGYTTYMDGSYPEGPTKTGTAAAFVLAGIAQLGFLVTNLTAVNLVGTVCFVGGFIGYVLLNRR